MIPDPQYERLNERLDQAINNEIDLEAQYKDKFKGTAYSTRKTILMENQEKIRAQIKNMGTTTCLVLVVGRRMVKVSETLGTVETFRAYFTGINPADAIYLCRRNIHGYIDGEAKTLELGKPL